MDPQPTPANPAPDSPEYHEQMTLSAATLNPSIIPQQFNGDPVKYAASVKEMRAELTRQSQRRAELEKLLSQPEPEGTPEPAPVFEEDLKSFADKGKPEDTTKPVDKQEEPVVEAGVFITIEDIQSDWNANDNSMSADMRAKLEKVLDPSIVDRYLQLEKSYIEFTAFKAANLVGGQDNLNKLIKLAREKLTTEQLAVIDTDLADPNRMETTLLGLKARLGFTSEAQASSEGVNKVSSSVNAMPSSVQPYSNQAEQDRDVNDPRYRSGSDPEFAAHVMARLRATNPVQTRR